MMPRADNRAPARGRLFPAATSPRRFLCSLAEQIAGLADWRRGAAWLPDLLAQRPSLSQGPLFGSSLAAAVRDPEARAEIPSPRAAAAPGVFPPAPGSQPRDRANAGGGSQRLPGLSLVRGETQAPLPPKYRTRAEGTLLAALAGPVPAGHSSRTGKTYRVFDADHSGRRHLLPQAEAGRLIRSLARRLASVVGSPEAEGAQRPESGAPVAESVVAGLPPWAAPLAGPAVPRAYLEEVLHRGRAEKVATFSAVRGLNRDSPPQAPPNSQPRRSREGHSPADSPRSPSGFPPFPTARGGWDAMPYRPGEYSAGRGGPAPGDFRAGRPAGRLDRGQTGENAGPTQGFATGGRGAPVQAPEATEPLGPAPSRGEPDAGGEFWQGPDTPPGARFFAALRQQRSPRRGEFDPAPADDSGAAADDLDDLAAKLQRILVEQARRHGIDV